MKNEVKVSLPQAEKQTQLTTIQNEITDQELDKVVGGINPQPLPPRRAQPAVYL
jgi:bacteriocin-like protein